MRPDWRRALCVIALCAVLSACSSTVKTVSPEVTPLPGEVPAVSCPEPQPCVCPELEEVVIPTPVPVPCTRDPQELQVVGGVEWVWIGDDRIRAKARVDTGAKTSSLHAEKVVEFERDGQPWVRFLFDAEQGQPARELEFPIERKVRIKRHDEKPQRRVVVRLSLVMGDMKEIVEVTLNDRSDFDFPVLIGRNFLTDNALVDVSRKFVGGS